MTASNTLPLIFCLGFKDWYFDHLTRCLESIRRHTLSPIIVVDLNSRLPKAVKSIVTGSGAVCLRISGDTWSRSVALNRAATWPTGPVLNQARSYVFTDADMFFPASWFERVRLTLRDKPEQMWLTHSRDLSPEFTAALPLPWMPQQSDLEIMMASDRHPSIGQGAAMVVPIKWFTDVGGFDEAYQVWGAEDNDLVLRAQWSGLGVDWLEPATEAWVAHQYHTRTWATQAQFEQVKRNRDYLAQRELERGPIVRNHGST